MGLGDVSWWRGHGGCLGPAELAEPPVSVDGLATANAGHHVCYLRGTRRYSGTGRPRHRSSWRRTWRWRTKRAYVVAAARTEPNVGGHVGPTTGATARGGSRGQAHRRPAGMTESIAGGILGLTVAAKHTWLAVDNLGTPQVKERTPMVRLGGRLGWVRPASAQACPSPFSTPDRRKPRPARC